MDTSQDLDIMQISEVMDSESTSNWKSKEDNDKRTQAVSNCRQICAMSSQVHGVCNFEIVEHVSENDEKSNAEDLDDHPAQIMVPSGKYLIGKRYVKVVFWTYQHGKYIPIISEFPSFRSVQMEFE